MIRNKPDWLILLKAAPQARLRLIGFPYAGGGAQSFRSLASKFPLPVEIYAAQLPGRETRLNEPALADLKAVIPPLTAAIQRIGGVQVFFGHSLGAILAFEVIRALRQQQAPLPALLIASARRAPQVEKPDARLLYNLPHQEFIEELRDLNGTPEAVLQNAELMALMLPTLRADFALSELYDYHDEPALPLPIRVFGGLRDRDVPRADLLAWQQQTSAEFKLRMFPGDHFFIHQDEPQLLQALTREVLPLLTDGRPA